MVSDEDTCRRGGMLGWGGVGAIRPPARSLESAGIGPMSELSVTEARRRRRHVVGSAILFIFYDLRGAGTVGGW